MNMRKVKRAKAEAERFLQRVAELEKTQESRSEDEHWLWGSKETGAVRRASMDLTRALADLRRPL